MLTIKNLSKSFGDIKALDDVSFEVDDGEFVFVAGPSGAGKTTLIRLILRELLPDSGEIYLGDKNVVELKPREVPKFRQQIGVVFQDYKILPERTLRENVEVALAVINLPQSEWQARVNNVLELVGLGSRASLFPSQLSGGELQRATLARALVVNPEIILADEPTGNLDWDTADEVMKLFEKVNEEGKTILMATHHRLILEKYGSVPPGGKLKRKTISLKEGRLVEIRQKGPKGKGEKEEVPEKKKKKIKIESPEA
jgi:cell division transport system ATP-binding protein